MRTSPTTSAVIPFPASSHSFGRRPLPAFFAGLTCLVLVKHQETERALFVSDDADKVGAVWVPKAWLMIDPTDRGRILVANLSKAVAEQKGLRPSLFDPAHLLPGEADLVTEAEALAARTRNRMRGARAPMSWSGGRNVFA